METGKDLSKLLEEYDIKKREPKMESSEVIGDHPDEDFNKTFSYELKTKKRRRKYSDYFNQLLVNTD